jgi:hypothetical protein
MIAHAALRHPPRHDAVSLLRLLTFAGSQIFRGRHCSGAPPQQLSVRYPMSAFIVSKRAA